MVYIIDLIGIHSGGDYYDIAFASELNKNNINTEILSTFSNRKEKAFFKIMYKENILFSLTIMFFNFLKLFFFMLKRRKEVFIFLSYGEITDFLFFLLKFIPRVFIVDIHELYSVRCLVNSNAMKCFNYFYQHIINNVIYHSNKTLELLDKLGYRKTKIYVPHFKYNIDTSFDSSNVSSDVGNVFLTNKTKFLFFGNFRIVKGIDVVLDILKNNSDLCEFAEFVFAGKNVENIEIDCVRNKSHVIDRHINDDEMKYLYSKTDYVLLPYRDSSQSGVLEMAFLFRKPMIFSDIEYFRLSLSKFPSLGVISSLNDYSSVIRNLVYKEDKNNYFTKETVDNFMLKKEIDNFICKLKKLITDIGQ